jgi:hypothetical protein
MTVDALHTVANYTFILGSLGSSYKSQVCCPAKRIVRLDSYVCTILPNISACKDYDIII